LQVFELALTSRTANGVTCTYKGLFSIEKGNDMQDMG